MNFKEFLKVNPGEIEKAKECNSIEEFKKLVDKRGITYRNEEELNQAYAFVKGENEGLSEDMLEAASGGKKNKEKFTDLEDDRVYKNDKGNYIYKNK